MTLELRDPNQMLGLVDATNGTVDRRMFFDQDIYELELERIYARSWLFMCHDSQIPNPGDFFMTFMGEDRVIVVRDNDGLPQVLVNSCRHRGNAVCRAEEGHSSSFMCTYHGWTYDLKGNLVGVPGFKEVYHEELDRENWGLIKAAQVGSYQGFIFANMDPEAPELDEYLGEVGRISLDLLAQKGDEMVMIPGVQKYTIPCNWKLSVDNVWDWYHANISHASAFQSGYLAPRPGSARGKLPDGSPAPKPEPVRRTPFIQKQQVVLGEYGHAVSGPLYDKDNPGPLTIIDETWRDRPDAVKNLGPVGLRMRGHPNIFPTMWITGNQISLRHPKGPSQTEIWWFTLISKTQDLDLRQQIAARASHTFGPAGMLEQEDGENWGESTKAARGFISQRYPLNYQMNKGLGKVINEEGSPPSIETNVNEHAQLWLYRAWSEWMASETWDDLKRLHSSVPRDIV
jgi:nitrite reductase/ring-hydroxylating ferredoxin subunit